MRSLGKSGHQEGVSRKVFHRGKYPFLGNTEGVKNLYLLCFATSEGAGKKIPNTWEKPQASSPHHEKGSVLESNAVSTEMGAP